MFIKVVCILVILAVALAEEHKGHSSVHISRHDGKTQPVTIHDKHGHEHHVDYYADSKYKFGYGIDTKHYHHEEKEHRDGHDNENEYKVKVEHHYKHH